MGKTKMRSFKVFDHPQQVDIANQTTRHEFNITILILDNIMPKYHNFVFYNHCRQCILTSQMNSFILYPGILKLYPVEIEY